MKIHDLGVIKAFDHKRRVIGIGKLTLLYGPVNLILSALLVLFLSDARYGSQLAISLR